MKEFLSILLFGAMVGWLTGKLIRGRGYGLVMNTIIGILGAGMGALLFRLFGLEAYGLLGMTVMSVVGAGCLLWIVGSTRRDSSSQRGVIS